MLDRIAAAAAGSHGWPVVAQARTARTSFWWVVCRGERARSSQSHLRYAKHARKAIVGHCTLYALVQPVCLSRTSQILQCLGRARAPF